MRIIRESRLNYFRQKIGEWFSQDIGRVFVFAAWFGIVSGLIEAVIFSIIRIVPAWITWQLRITNVSSEIFWAAPVVDFFLFTLVACVLVLLLPLWNYLIIRFAPLKRVPFSVFAVLIFSWMGLYAALVLPDRFSNRAALLLALGIAVQITRMYQNRSEAAASFIRISIPPLVFIIFMAVIVTRGGPRLIELAKSRNALPANDQAPNVLLIVVDTLRADHLSLYGYPKNTSPNLNRIASEGVVFENAIASSSWTPPTHASIFTGRLVSEHHVDGWQPVLDKQYPTLAEVLNSKGYLTAGFSGNTLWVTRNSGFSRGFTHFEDYFTNAADVIFRTAWGKEVVSRFRKFAGCRDLFGRTNSSTGGSGFIDQALKKLRSTPACRDIFGRKRADAIDQAFLGWLDRNSGHPFFAFINYFDVHGPYLSPEPFHTQFMDENQLQEEPLFNFSPNPNGPKEKRDLLIAGYDGSISYVDAEIGILLDELTNRGILDNTIVIITSDHGESFGEHGFFEHGYGLNYELIHVPLIIRYPKKVPAGLRITTTVKDRSIPATIMSLAFNDDQLFPGISLQNYWSQEKIDSDGVLSELEAKPWFPTDLPISQGWIKSLVIGDWQIIMREDQTSEIYNVINDPNETRNLANTSAEAEIIAKFGNILDKRFCATIDEFCK